MSVILDYDHRRVVSPLKLVQERRDAHGFQPAFGTSDIRFGLTELTTVPGVGEYDTSISSVMKRTPSFSKKGFGAFASRQARAELFEDKKTPGPAHYKLPEFGYLAPDQQRPSTNFIASGHGRVPFPPPKDIPGPLDYWVNYDPGRSPILMRKRSATFESVTTRDSFFDKVSPAPGPGKYKTEKANKLVFTTGGNSDIDWKRSSIPDRFDHIGKDNQVPGVHTYFQKPYVHPRTNLSSPTSMSRPSTTGSPLSRPSTTQSQSQSTFGEFLEPLPSPVSKKVLVRTGSSTSYVLTEAELNHSTHHYNNDKIPSLRSVGNYKGKLLGKQNATPVISHTFGADKNRFKNSVFGRLDLAAEIPGPGTYDYPLSMGKLANKQRRAQTAPEGSARPKTRDRESPNNAAHVSFKPLKSPSRNSPDLKKPGHQFDEF